ncbi:hypothetical protein PSPO01_13736 [Paraphaeosphaeria sporulosa]
MSEILISDWNFRMSHVESASVAAAHMTREGNSKLGFVALGKVQSVLTKVRLAILPKQDFAMIPNIRQR